MVTEPRIIAFRIHRFEIEPLAQLLLMDENLANLRFESLDVMFRFRGEKHRERK